MRTGVKDAEVLDGDMRFCLVLPREAVSVPVMRRVLGGALLGFGADEDCVADILLAASEACTNVLRHGDGTGRSGEYEVSASVGRDDCLLEIANGLAPDGTGPTRRPIGHFPRNGWRARRFQARAAPEPEREQDLSAVPESGRGLTIMRACVDDLSLRGAAGRGTVVSMRKKITWAPAVTGRHAGGPRPAGDDPALRQVG